MAKYTLPQKARIEFPDAMLGLVEREFEAGSIEPKSELDALALEKLVEAGLATRHGDTVDVPEAIAHSTRASKETDQ